MPSLDLLINHGSEEEATRDPRPSPSCKSCKCEIRASDFFSKSVQKHALELVVRVLIWNPNEIFHSLLANY